MSITEGIIVIIAICLLYVLATMGFIEFAMANPGTALVMIICVVFFALVIFGAGNGNYPAHTRARKKGNAGIFAIVVIVVFIALVGATCGRPYNSGSALPENQRYLR